jgi:hypothetical protein
LGSLHIAGTVRGMLPRFFLSPVLLPVAWLCASVTVMASPVTGLNCNWTTSPAYPCIVESPIASDGSEVPPAMLDIQNPYFWDYIQDTAFGHCSWAGGIVHRCAEARFGAVAPGFDDGPGALEPPGGGGQPPGGGTEHPGGGGIPDEGDDPPLIATPEPASGGLILSALAAAAVRRRKPTPVAPRTIGRIPPEPGAE